jgi:LCP family protein required for cell wall assembly
VAAHSRHAAFGPSLARAAAVLSKVAIAALAALVVAGTGFAWSQIRTLNRGIAGPAISEPSPGSGGHGAVGPTEEQNILLVGVDTRTTPKGKPLGRHLRHKLHAGSAGAGGDTTDTIIVIHIPAGGRQAVGFSIPRDSYVHIAGGYGKHKINSAYAFANKATRKRLKSRGVTGAALSRQAKRAGAHNTISTVEQLTGLHIDHYAEANLAGFYNLSKAVGGVPVCLKRPTYDPHTGVHFRAGTYPIAGARALAFVRQRHGIPHADLGRIRRQQAFLASLAEKVLSDGLLTHPGRLHRLVGAITGALTLDLDCDVLAFAEELQSLSAGDISFHTIPVGTTELQTPSDGLAVQVDPQRVRGYIQRVISGRSPAGATGAPSNASSTPPPDGPRAGSSPSGPGSSSPSPAGRGSALHAGGGPTCVY